MKYNIIIEQNLIHREKGDPLGGNHGVFEFLLKKKMNFIPSVGMWFKDDQEWFHPVAIRITYNIPNDYFLVYCGYADYSDWESNRFTEMIKDMLEKAGWECDKDTRQKLKKSYGDFSSLLGGKIDG